MNHMQSISGAVAKAASNNAGTYLVLAGQIVSILATFFADKEIFVPEEETEGEAQ